MYLYIDTHHDTTRTTLDLIFSKNTTFGFVRCVSDQSLPFNRNQTNKTNLPNMEVPELPSTNNNTTTGSNIPSSRASTKFVQSSKKKEVLFNLIDQTYNDDENGNKKRQNDTQQLKKQTQPSNPFVLFSIFLITSVWFLITYVIWSFLLWMTSSV